MKSVILSELDSIIADYKEMGTEHRRLRDFREKVAQEIEPFSNREDYSIVSVDNFGAFKRMSFSEAVNQAAELERDEGDNNRPTFFVVKIYGGFRKSVQFDYNVMP